MMDEVNTAMHAFLINMLECPACHGMLEWRYTERDEVCIETAEARCAVCEASYPVCEGIGVFLTSDLPREGLWEQFNSHLALYLCEHPEIERKLMKYSMDTLNPADQQLRAMTLEERGAYEEARFASDAAYNSLYTPEYRACYERQIAYLVEHLRSTVSPIIDLASGRCSLVEVLLRELKGPIVATDFSPSVLRRSRKRLAHLGLGERLSLLAFDARRTPFKDSAIGFMTTNLGLSNVEQPGNLLSELRRIVSGELLTISYFYPRGDETNAAVIHKLGLGELLFRDTLLHGFADAGWKVEVMSECRGWAEPTVSSQLLEGTQIDTLPVSGTNLEWCLLSAS